MASVLKKYKSADSSAAPASPVVVKKEEPKKTVSIKKVEPIK